MRGRRRKGAGSEAARNAARIVATESSIPKGDLRGFHSVEGLAPPEVRIRTGPAPGTSPGYIFVTPRAAEPAQATGPMILDHRGRMVWFNPVKGRSFVGLTSQTWKGKPVLTWSERPPIKTAADLWGNQPYFSEYTAEGQQLSWSGRPTGRPAVAAVIRDGRTVVYVSWNGATEVARWRVLGGPGVGGLKPVGTGDWQGFETKLDIAAARRVIKVEALDRAGNVIGSSGEIRPQAG